MSIENEILRLQNAKAALKSYINAKGGTIDAELIDAYPAFVDAIEIAEWQPNPAWPNLRTIIDNDTEPYIGKVAVMYGDYYDTFDFDLSVMQAQAVKTSDGGFYTANATHTWDKLQDIDDGSPIKKRWVIWYYSDATSASIISSDQLYLGEFYWIVVGSDGTLFNWKYEHIIGTYTPTTNSNGFKCSYLEAIENYNGGMWDTSDIITFSNMFNNCASLQTIPLLDTSNVTSMYNTFDGCISLQTIPQLDTSNVTSMNNMFNGCTSLKTIPQLDTSKVTSMYSMFNGCASLQTIPLLDTSNVTSMYSMFDGCTSLQTMPPLDTSNVTSMSNMFHECRALRSVTQLDTSKVADVGWLFRNCYNLHSFPELNLVSLTTPLHNYIFYRVGYYLESGFEIEITFTPNALNVAADISRGSLTYDSLISFIGCLVDRSATTTLNVILGATNIAKLNQTELDLITAKNWTYS